MTGAANTDTIADNWLAKRSQKAADNSDARQWLDGQAVDFTAAITDISDGIYTDGYYLGNQAATSLVTGDSVDWGNWTPGDSEAARQALGTDGGAGLDQLLQQVGVTIKSINSNRLDDLAQALADALEAGDTAETLAGTLSGILADPAWSLMVAQTELTRAISAASKAVYQRHQVASMYWLDAEDERVCPVCADNDDAGAVPIDQPFPSGDYYPPAHPLCRCALAPAVDQ